MSSDEEVYKLPRDDEESARLKQQHHVVTENIGFYIHPAHKHRVGAHARVADVACGTGHWLAELAASLPATCQFDGFDIKFPTRMNEGTSSNVRFHEVDVLKGFPEQYHGKFDMVRIRYLVLGLGPDDWSTVARNVAQILKPGGFFQWEEPSIGTSYCLCSDPTSSTAALDQVMGLWSSIAPKYADNDITNIPETLRQAGLETSAYRVSSDRVPSTRKHFTAASLPGVIAVFKKMVEAGKFHMSKAEVGDLLVRCQHDWETGGYLRANLHIAMGVKPS